LRYRAAFDSALFTEVLGIMIGTVFEFLQRRAHDTGIPKANISNPKGFELDLSSEFPYHLCDSMIDDSEIVF